MDDLIRILHVPLFPINKMAALRVEDDVNTAAAAPRLVGERPAHIRIRSIKTCIVELHARDTEARQQIERDEGQIQRLQEQIQRGQRVRDEVAVEMAAAKAELDAAVAAPVACGVDPTVWLADELLILILLQVGWGGQCRAVCRRWHRLRNDGAVKRQLREGRWEEYAAGWMEPREPNVHVRDTWSLALGPNDRLYSGDFNGVKIWSSPSGTCTLLRTLSVVYTEGLEDNPVVLAIAVANGGTIYSGDLDGKIQMWSGESGVNFQTLIGHTSVVKALTIGATGNVFSGSHDKTIRMWCGRNGAHLRTLVGHTKAVRALAVSPEKLYSGSADMSIRVWSATDGAHLQTLTGHTQSVDALALGPDGSLFSGSRDGTVRVWSGIDGSHLRTLPCDAGVASLAVGRDGMLFVGLVSGALRVWRKPAEGTYLCTLSAPHGCTDPQVAVSAAGTLYTGWRRFGHSAVSAMQIW
jgi:hypothetical protein